MATRRYVQAPPRITAVGNADLDVVITLREAVALDAIDEVTYTTPQLGNPIDLTGFVNLRGQLRQTRSAAGLLTGAVADNTPRATMSVAILGFPADGQLRVRVAASRLWAMQQANVRSGYFDIVGEDGDGVTWSLVTDGLFSLSHAATPPFTPSADEPSLLPADVYASPDALLPGNLTAASSTSTSSGVTDHGALTGLGDDDHVQYLNAVRATAWLATAALNATNLTSGSVPNARITSASVTQHVIDIITAIDGTLGGSTWQGGGGGGSMSANDILAALLTVDGAASGLDADLLDGQSSAFYRDAANLNAGTVPNAQIAQASVTQHQAALSIAATQVTGLILPSQMKIAGWTLAKPGAYPVTPPILPRRTIRGWTGSVSARSLRTVTGGTATYYVDVAKGNNGNAGTSGAPFRSVWHALNQSDVGVVKVAPGVYTLQDTWKTPTMTISATNAYAVERWPVREGEVILTTAKHSPTWTLVSKYSTCSVAAGAPGAVKSVIDLDVAATDGGYASYEEVTSAPLCDDQPGSWYHDTGANLLYVHPLRPGVPGRSVLVMEGAYNGAVDTGGRRSIYIEGLTFISGGSGFLALNTTGVNGGQVVAVRCSFHNNHLNGFQPQGYATVAVEDCKAMRNRIDGMSYVVQGGQVTTNAVEVRCEYAWNGYIDPLAVGTDASNGSSVHNNMNITRIACRSWMNMGPQWADINTSYTWMVGCEAGQSAAFDEDTQSSGFQVGANSFMWLYDCVSRVNLHDSVTAAGANLYTDQVELSVMTISGGTNSTYVQT